MIWRRFIHPVNIRDRLDDNAEAEGPKYDAYQLLLTNIMTVGALLLGFIVTGTMLSVSLTGAENYASDKLLEFLKSSGLAAAFSGSAMIMAMVISIKATQRFANQGAHLALRNIRRSTAFIGIAEIGLYLSLFSFLDSVSQFVVMNYTGPDICPVVDDKLKNAVRKQAKCSQLGQDLYETAKEYCKPGDPHGVLCEEFKKYNEQQNTSHSYTYFGWQVDDSTVGYGSQARLTVVDQVIKLFCNKAMADRNMEKLCLTGESSKKGSTELTDETTVGLCSEAIVANSMADQCYSSNARDVDTCYKVCAWRVVDGEHRSPLLEIGVYIERVVHPIYVLFVILIIWRSCACLGQVQAVCLLDYNNCHDPLEVLLLHTCANPEIDSEESETDDAA